MSKRDFYPMFMAAWEASFKKETILKAFEATGLSPLNPEVILKRFIQPAQSGQSSDSDSSALSASNWRKTERLLRQVVHNRSDPRAQKLSRAFHSISVQKSLLTHEAQGLMQALVNERQRRKRGKALPLEAGEDYHGGAVFWSPRKVKEALDRQHQQGLEEERLQHQRAEAARLREIKKQEKLQAAQQKRAARAAAQIIRQEEKAREATDRALRQAARKAQQQLRQAQKTS
ncbi:hypothetical protein TUN199_11454 [Pyrenophora tritici-repentis]|nr:hypothetical protein Alg215_11725 [Pyrenophora tritici-repentis]KAI0569735.1 hypothetical protein Alg130_11523 [Pyrenophora tritici-repentis]KAI0604307.1 hypothetical protein TUN205_11446 [Pyrenophora tritici-repentis]KAI0616554.1 hypothetical protein TUN199_11454 [Pyrenophora tritici-repentis]KAI1522075.1 hypothetical protein PtrSN001C_011988 [Pyrenophora tritici-repentis]